MANISSMITPCMVNAWLNCSVDMICRPGRASSARIARASSPPRAKKPKDVTMYTVPIFLWSVVVIQSTITEPMPRGSGVCGSAVSGACPV